MPFPLDEKWIADAEKELGLRLPESYRNRLKRDNGGEVEAAGDWWTLHPIFDQSSRKRLKRTCNHVLAETNSAQSWRGFPKDGLAIATNSCGDHLLLLLSDKVGDSFDAMVWYWSHETGEKEVIADFAELAP
jgi:hypothetical protein